MKGVFPVSKMYTVNLGQPIILSMSAFTALAMLIVKEKKYMVSYLYACLWFCSDSYCAPVGDIFEPSKHRN